MLIRYRKQQKNLILVVNNLWVWWRTCFKIPDRTDAKRSPIGRRISGEIAGEVQLGESGRSVSDSERAPRRIGRKSESCPQTNHGAGACYWKGFPLNWIHSSPPQTTPPAHPPDFFFWSPAATLLARPQSQKGFVRVCFPGKTAFLSIHINDGEAIAKIHLCQL